ncbi:hypothetical protein BDN72DRAFT_892598 [Pluteus cervinus]|uniref:Uncharacterized protein n=1 Tax=Pluteus cervinus TaxID=181527 RepID=A0ACD3BB70_9AGAR|nr:hypothetical protein BDN72DRAFT_892598 [Pluteus cervinus]
MSQVPFRSHPTDDVSHQPEDSLALTDPKFPHTRAQLAAIARQYKTIDNYDSDTELDDFNRIPNALLTQVVSFLRAEQEDDLKALLKKTFEMDDETVCHLPLHPEPSFYLLFGQVEQNVLDLMHKHHDDVAGVPFLFLTPTRRPISRPSSRASTHSARAHLGRPDTPTSAPTSPLAMVFRRPHTPATSPLAGGGAQPSSYISARSDYSPSSSPVLAHTQATQAHAQFTASLPSSPLSSPRLLNAKASEFKPIPRPLSAASSVPGIGIAFRAETPPPDPWAHSSPRATSNLAIAAPLIADQTPLPRASTSSTLRSSLRPGDDDDDDPFDPFVTKTAPQSFHSITVSDFDTQWSNSSNSSTSPEESYYVDNPPPFHNPYAYMPMDNHGTSGPNEASDVEAESVLTDGMTPFDVLSSVFGSTLAPSELEEALLANAYDFDKAMVWLVERALPPTVPQSTQIRVQQHLGARVNLVSRDPMPSTRGRGFVPPSQPPDRGNGRFVNGRPAPTGNRVCRYFVAGECLRADCRYSHDLERALCRFWLRGTCAKQESCEFLHRLPQDVDVSGLGVAMGRAHIQPGPVISPPNSHPPPEEFPVLGFNSSNGTRGKRQEKSYSDAGRTRFAAAVKKPAAPQNTNQYGVRKEIMGPSLDDIHHRSAIIAPRVSPRLKLRPPALLPTLSTGESINSLYLAYRSRALQLGAARNACLSRAADAWRRGDGAAAKRFSREGHDLNAKMSAEMATAAGKLVRERAKTAEQAVKNRDAGWSDDPGDRTARGKLSGGGLGVCLGVASREIGDGKLTAEERTETVLDLHGLHANEATEVLEEFLLALEQEHFYGLAYIVVGEEKHTGTQDPARGSSRARLATGVREWVHRWGYPWMERDGILCVDPLTHLGE